MRAGPSESAGRAGSKPPAAAPVGQGGHLPAAGRRQGARAFGVSRGGDLLRAGIDSPARVAGHAPEDRARNRSSSRPPSVTLPAGRTGTSLGVSRGSRRAGQNARRSATARVGVGVSERPSNPRWRSRPRRAHIGQRVEAIAESLGDAPLQIAAHYYLAAAAHLSGDYRGTEDLCRKLIESLHGSEPASGSVS